jgi:TPP-dependent indolepyruvate ferredoxin oxidoreductase alpha subunit
MSKDRKKLPRAKHSALPDQGIFMVTSAPWITFSNVYGSEHQFFGIIEQGKKMVYQNGSFQEMQLADNQIEKLYNLNIVFPTGAAPSMEVSDKGKRGIMACQEVQLVLKKASFASLIQVTVDSDVEMGRDSDFGNPIGRKYYFRLVSASYQKSNGENISYKKLEVKDGTGANVRFPSLEAAQVPQQAETQPGFEDQVATPTDGFVMDTNAGVPTQQAPAQSQSTGDPFDDVFGGETTPTPSPQVTDDSIWP